MSKAEPTEASARAGEFATTRWTSVLEARGESPEATKALSDLCAVYYASVFAFIRRNSLDEESARDRTQEFFARLLARHGIANADPQRGRFRSYLLGAVKHFLADEHARAQRLKRGLGTAHQSIETGGDTTHRLQVPDAKAPNPEHEFDRKWALTVLDRALMALKQEHEAAGKSEVFEALKPWLTGDNESTSQLAIAQGLGLSEGAVKVAIHRLRRQFRQTIKSEIAQTVRDPSQVDEELHHLQQALLY